MPRTQTLALFSVVLLCPGCEAEEATSPTASGKSEVQAMELPSQGEPYAPLADYGAMDIPEDNPLTAEKVALGRQLYHDTRLSGDGSRSCYSCHTCENGLSDGRETALGAHDKQLTRNSPTLWNIGFHLAWYWDGRADTLEGQAFAAWKGGNMGAGDDLPKIVENINAMPEYNKQFQAVFGEDATEKNIPQALASHMRTFIGGHTAFDRWQAGDESAVSEAAKRGYAAFQKAKCVDCHTGKLLTDLVFHNVGIGFDPATGKFADEGRGAKTKQEKEIGAFKTPTLRDVSQSGPYFHDGSVADLSVAVRLMVIGGVPNPGTDEKLKKADLTDAEIQDLLEFLKSLDEECSMPAPTLPSSP